VCRGRLDAERYRLCAFVLGDESYRCSLIVEDAPKSVDPLLAQLVLSRYESNLCY
jgi:hypothetical protein